MLALRLDLIEKCVAETFRGSIAQLAAAWPVAPAPHRSTVLRWLKEGTLPRSAKDFLALAGALDVDPFALWSLRVESFDLLCSRILRVSRARRWSQLHLALSFLDSFIGPLAEWPPTHVAEEYYHRLWRTVEFEHPAQDRQNYYAAIGLEPGPTASFAEPQVWHFAYRDAGLRGAAWRPYGFVEVCGLDVRLFNFSGLTDASKLSQRHCPFCVETWFGQGAAKFRITSLHDFRLTLRSRTPESLPKVRFALPASRH